MAEVVHATAREVHHARHLGAVWDAIPPGRRGVLSLPKSLHHLHPEATATGTPRSGPTLVASYGDLRRLRGARAAYMEHGAGQTYLRPHDSYANGRYRPNVGLWLAQSDRVAGIVEDTHPGARTAVVGLPYLDRAERRPEGRREIAVVSFHFDATVAPESRSALRHYVGALPQIARDLAGLGLSLVGHGHRSTAGMPARL